MKKPILINLWLVSKSFYFFYAKTCLSTQQFGSLAEMQTFLVDIFIAKGKK